MEDLEAVQEWRTRKNIVGLNNPSSVWRAYNEDLREEAAKRIKEEKAARAKAVAEFPVDYVVEDDNPYVAARDEVSEGEEDLQGTF
jgi:hypothetical protein